jgi:PilZ domain
MCAGEEHHFIMRQKTMVVDAPIAPAQQQSQPSDQRQAERHQVRLSAIVSVIGTSAPVIRCEIQNISERGVQIWLDQPLQYASLVRIEYDDSLILGEVVYCKQEQAGWLVGIHAEHALFGLTALAHALSGKVT